MNERNEPPASPGPERYWRLGPVYVQERLVLLALILCSAAVLLLFGPPFRPAERAEGQLPAYRYDDPRLAGISGAVQVLDADGRTRYVGEVAAGAYTGLGQVFDADGALVYDGPLVDGVYEGADARVYRAGVLVYTGEMAGGVYEGQGRRLDPETGVVSEGQFSGGRLEGWGQEFYPGGALLRQGIFSRDLLEGEGEEYSEAQVLLREGTFSAGVLHGDGREYTSGGALRYEGQFRRGSRHGQGVLYDTQLGVRSAEGSFEDGRLTGQGTLYHPSGQPLYTGRVCGLRPRADAFLGLSLAEVEAAFTTHWLLYSCEGVTAFVYPSFALMFITESPVRLTSPAQAEEEAEQERQALLHALERPAGEDGGGDAPAADATEESPPQPALYDDEVLSPDTEKGELIITEVLSLGQPLACAGQPGSGSAAGQHRPGWREWFSELALGGDVQDAAVRRSGQFIWRFSPRSSSGEDGYVNELVEEYAGVELMTVRREDKDMSLWYQSAKWGAEHG